MNLKTRSLTIATALLSLTALGCEQPGTRGAYAPTMRIGVVGPDAPQPIVKIDSRPVATHVSELTVTVSAASLVGRRVLATVADVDRVEVLVKAADGSEFTATVSKAQLNAGTVSVTFPAVPLGTATVTLTAYDATNKAIGTSSRTATVVAGTTTPVSVPLTLTPSVAAPTSGGSGTTPTTGGLAVNGTIQDGPSLPAGVLSWFNVPIYFWDLHVDGTGRAWVAGESMTSAIGRVNAYDADGNVTATVSRGNEISGAGLDNAGNLYAMIGRNDPTDAGAVYRYSLSDLTAAPVQVRTGGHEYISVESGSGGHVWAGYQLVTALPQVVQFDAWNQIFGTEFGEYSSCSAVDASGNLWVADFSNLVRVSAADGSHTAVSTTLDRNYVVTTDAAGDIWVAGRIGDLPAPLSDDPVSDPNATGTAYVVHLKPDGTYVDKVAVGNQVPLGMYVDPSGNMYLSLINADQVVKYSPAGALLKTYSLNSPARMAFGGGNLWVSVQGPSDDCGLARLEQ